MSLGATMAWTICMNRAGIWIVRPFLVFFTVASTIILSLSAILESFLTFDCLHVSLVGEVLPLKCKGTREYVRKTPSLPLAREMAGVHECGATFRFKLVGQFYSYSFLLWSSGQICTMFSLTYSF